MNTPHSSTPEQLTKARGMAERLQELVNTIGARLEPSEAGMVVLNIALVEALSALEASKRELTKAKELCTEALKQSEARIRELEQDHPKLQTVRTRLIERVRIERQRTRAALALHADAVARAEIADAALSEAAKTNAEEEQRIAVLVQEVEKVKHWHIEETRTSAALRDSQQRLLRKVEQLEESSIIAKREAETSKKNEQQVREAARKIIAAVDDKRRQLWHEVAVAVARSEHCTDRNGPGVWANNAVDAYDKRFPTPTTP